MKHAHTSGAMTQHDRLAFAGWLCALLAIIALASLGCSGCTMPSLNSPSASDVLEDEYGRLVLVSTACVLEPSPGVVVELDGKRGSGVRIGGHAVLTAKHVVDCGPLAKATVTVSDLDEKAYAAQVEAVLDTDVARLEVAELSTMPPVATARARLGDQVCAVVRLPEPGRTCGEVQPGSRSGDAGSVRVRIVGEHGNSGAGAYNAAGALVGIVAHLRWCLGTENNGQVCTAGITPLVPRIRWVVAP